MPDSELAIRIAHLERKVAHLYRCLGRVEPDVSALVTGEPDPRSGPEPLATAGPGKPRLQPRFQNPGSLGR